MLHIYLKNRSQSSIARWLPSDAAMLSDRAVDINITGPRTAEIRLSAARLDLAGCRLIPTLAIDSQQQYGYRFSMRISPQYSEITYELNLPGIGAWPGLKEPPGNAAHGVRADIDYFLVDALEGMAEILCEVHAPDIEAALAAPLFLGISVTAQDVHAPADLPDVEKSHEIAVPPKSQMVFDQQIRERICSPTGLSMVLDYYGRITDPLAMADLAYHKDTDLYGVWPANIWAASRCNTLGYVHVFRDIGEVRALLDRDVPLIASIRYKEGELTNAAMERSYGHLVVVRGYRGNEILVNDPAGEVDSAVARAYDVREFSTVWLDRTGVAYILIPV